MTDSPNTMGMPVSCDSAQLVQLVERILECQAHTTIKSGDRCILAQTTLVQAERAEPRPAVGERGCHAVEGADPVEQGADGTVVVLQAIGAIHLEAHVDPSGCQAVANR